MHASCVQIVLNCVLKRFAVAQNRIVVIFVAVISVVPLYAVGCVLAEVT